MLVTQQCRTAAALQIEPKQLGLSGFAVVHTPLVENRTLPNGGPGIGVSGQTIQLPSRSFPHSPILVSMRRARPLLIALALAVSTGGAWPATAQASTRGIITGTVTDAAGTPVAGAIVQYHDFAGEHEQVSTDQDGVYRLRVRAPHHAYLDVYTGEHPYPAWTGGDFSLEPKENITKDVSLTPTGVPTILYGRVTDSRTGRPVARLPIESLIHEGDNISDTVTDRDGWYAFTAYDAQGEGYEPMHGTYTYDLIVEPTRKYDGVSYNEEDASGAGPGIVVAEGQRVRFDFSLPRLG